MLATELNSNIVSKVEGQQAKGYSCETIELDSNSLLSFSQSVSASGLNLTHSFRYLGEIQFTDEEVLQSTLDESRMLSFVKHKFIVVGNGTGQETSELVGGQKLFSTDEKLMSRSFIQASEYLVKKAH